METQPKVARVASWPTPRLIREGIEFTQQRRPHEDDRLSKIPHVLLLEEPGVAVDLAAAVGHVAEQPAMKAIRGGSVRTVHSPCYDESRLHGARLPLPDPTHRGLPAHPWSPVSSKYWKRADMRQPCREGESCESGDPPRRRWMRHKRYTFGTSTLASLNGFSTGGAASPARRLASSFCPRSSSSGLYEYWIRT